MNYSLCQKCGHELESPAAKLTEAFHPKCLEEIKSQKIPQGPHCQNNCLIKGDPYECWEYCHAPVYLMTEKQATLEAWL